MTVLLPATWLPPHGDRRASADAMRANVLTHRRGLRTIPAPIRRPWPTAWSSWATH